MSEIKDDLRYSTDHEWVRVADDGLVVVGVTDYAQDKLGDVVMVELPDVGDELGAGDAFGTVESPKSVSDLFAPIAGEIVEVNEALEDAPEVVNEDPYGAGWIVKIRPAAASDVDTLLDAAAYGAHVERTEDA